MPHSSISHSHITHTCTPSHFLHFAVQDHLNDIMSNMCAIVTAVAAGLVPNGWWIDPAGAIAISLYIVTRWLAIAKQQVSRVITFKVQSPTQYCHNTSTH